MGQKFIRENIYRTGRGVADQIQWRAIFESEPSEADILAAAQAEFPAEGYGGSGHRKPKQMECGRWEVHYLSNASCD